MPVSAVLTLAILTGAAAVLIWGRWPPEVVALAATLLLVLGGVLDVPAAMAGFGSPALAAIAAVYVIGAGLERAGVASALARGILRATGNHEVRLILLFCGAAGLLSGVMNSVGAMAVLLPAAVAAARQAGISPSRLLLPLALGTRLGGNLTLISGPSNLLASQLLSDAGHRPLGLFELLPLGTAFLVTGVAYLALVGRRWLPDRGPSPGEEARLADVYRLAERLHALRISPASPLVGRTLGDSDLGRRMGLTVLAIVRGSRRIAAPSRDERLEAGDILVVAGRLDDPSQTDALRAAGLEVLDDLPEGALDGADAQLAELVLAPRSALEGRTVREVGFRERYGLTVVAVWQEGRPRRSGLADRPLRVGDALLVQGRRDRIAQLRRDPDFLVLGSQRADVRPDRAPWALASLAVLAVAATAGLPIVVATWLAAALIVLSGCLSADDLLQAVDWRVVVFTGALLPVGTALQATGAARALAGAALGVAGGGALAALATVVVVSVILNQVMPSVAATAVLVPVALQVAGALALSPHALAMAVIAGTGTTVTPLGNPVNLMVMGPGGYRMADYLRVGLPLAAVLTVVSLAVIPLAWPLR
ncbi:MAG: SLC13 family permease [Armatimonadota bacterium]|nr:SLC13 family permease [Armatimonadota bacterium]MDR7403185.1 SLC13 family permease [Armatimonadota bacterium]